ncbi:TetR/AcrR family transcriptional regulator [Conexibacter woesei]|uniref:TetR/AcrR family transcriptional regulator n=1 Tax=Conexibacter woesei TaxID=191495 RepID=UPI00041E9D3D|nr:TetR family transcriptional regulator [Conexibacter woesei]
MAGRPKTRLAPDARREQILEHARRVFGARSYEAVSASEIARAAGVTPALVSHYFPGGKSDIFVTLVGELRTQVVEAVRVDRELPMRERAAASIERWLTWLDANRETWLATAAHGDAIADPDLQRLVDDARELAIDGLVADYGDVLIDLPSTRLALRCWFGINRATCRAWLRGDATREQAALILAETLQQVITVVAPALAR